MRTTYDSYAITHIFPNGLAIGRNVRGENREFQLVVNINKLTDEMSFSVARHYVDPDSVSAVEISQLEPEEDRQIPETIPWEGLYERA